MTWELVNELNRGGQSVIQSDGSNLHSAHEKALWQEEARDWGGEEDQHNQ